MYELVNAKDAKVGEFGKFGLNTGILTKFEFLHDNEKNFNALDVTVKIGDSDTNKRYFEPKKLFGKNGELTEGTEEYKTAKISAEKQISATLGHFALAFISQQELEGLFASGKIINFQSFVETIAQAIKATPNWNTKELDVFLQYQFKPNENGKTFLELPTDVKHGLFIVPKLPGTWTEQRTSTHLRYTDEKGTIHPISRGQWFMESAFANPVDMPTAATETTPIPEAGIVWDSIT